MRQTRRTVLASLAAAIASPALGQALDALQMGVTPNAGDQSGPLQDALLRAATEGRKLFLPTGTYLVTNLLLPSDVVIEGVPGGTILATSGTDPVARISGNADVTLRGITFGTGATGPTDSQRGLLEIEASTRITITECSFVGSASNGISVRDASATITGCHFSQHAQAGIFSLNSRGLMISGNTVTDCGNGGILVWSSEARRDGSIISGNAISRIDWRGGGNGQNGNGINVYRSAEVTISDNHITDCAFTAVRLNATRDCQVTGNLCIKCGEVAIFSEFGFSGSVISDNIVDGAATGISITNLDSGGRLAVCNGNIVRNITATSAVNPDTRGVGIFAEADTVVSSNAVSGVEGTGILAGFGPYRSNIVVTGNAVSDVNYGIGVSLVDEPPAGLVTISNNHVSGARQGGIVGMRWTDVVVPDLAASTQTHRGVSVSGNQVG